MKLILLTLTVLLLSGCATDHFNVKIDPMEDVQIFYIEESIVIYLYKNRLSLQNDYPAPLREQIKIRGFYDPVMNSIHCVVNDYYCIGHELKHAIK